MTPIIGYTPLKSLDLLYCWSQVKIDHPGSTVTHIVYFAHVVTIDTPSWCLCSGRGPEDTQVWLIVTLEPQVVHQLDSAFSSSLIHVHLIPVVALMAWLDGYHRPTSGSISCNYLSYNIQYWNTYMPDRTPFPIYLDRGAHHDHGISDYI